jgi:hypothetical protein
MKNQSKMTNTRHTERGIAILYCLVALLILSAITSSLIMLSGTETSVNANYRSEEVAFFAAKTGVYEALDRMQQSNPNSIAANLPTAVPSASGGVLYVLNAGSSLTVKPWDSTNAYFDTEFCHEGYSIAGMTSAPPDVPCSSVPTGTGWYTTVNSNYPWSGTSVAMPYEWVRINWKENKTQNYISGGTSPAVSYYAVNSSQTATTPVCWNGGSEVLLSTPAGVTPTYTKCEQYQTCAPSNPVITTPVLMITALAVTSNGSRQMIQAEAALNPPSMTVSPCGISDPYGFFAYGGTCTNPGLIIGGNAFVDGYNSSIGPYSTSHSATLGSVGTNGGALEEGTSSSIGGTVYVPAIGSATPPGPGSCPGDDFSVSGSPHYGAVAQSTTLTPPTVTIPANSSTTDVSSGTIVPGNYRNVSVGSHGSITLTAPGTYNFDCLSADSFGTLNLYSTQKITINISGTGCASAPISFGSHAAINNCTTSACTTMGASSDIVINYPGNGSVSLNGGADMASVVNAPYAAVTVNGGADYYGTIMANTIDDHGGTNLHFDAADTTVSGAAASTAIANATGSYNTLALHALSY